MFSKGKLGSQVTEVSEFNPSFQRIGVSDNPLRGALELIGRVCAPCRPRAAQRANKKKSVSLDCSKETIPRARRRSRLKFSFSVRNFHSRTKISIRIEKKNNVLVVDNFIRILKSSGKSKRGLSRWGLKVVVQNCLKSGTKKEPKPKLLSPGIFRLGWGLPRQRVGAKKFSMSLKTREIKLFWRDIPGFCWDIPVLPEKFEKKKVCVQFSFPMKSSSVCNDSSLYERAQKATNVHHCRRLHTNCREWPEAPFESRKRGEYRFGEYGFKHRAH